MRSLAIGAGIVVALSMAACGLVLQGTGSLAADADPPETGSLDADVVDPATDAPSASDAASGPEGGVPDAHRIAPYATRVTNGLLAFYDFEENGGTTAHDSVSPAVDLTITKASDVSWKPHALSLDDYTRVQSSENFDKAITACLASQEITIEAWTVPALDTEDDYGRIVTMAKDDGNRNWALGTYDQTQTWGGMANGEDEKPSDKITSTLLHIVVTRTNDKTMHVYLNGKAIGTRTGTSDVSSWDAYPLTVGNVPTSGKGYKGEIHLVAIYGRALSPDEVKQNFSATADP